MPHPRESGELARIRRQHGWDIEARAQLHAGVWVPEAAQREELSYPTEGHARLAEVEDQSFWFRHRSAVVEDVLLGTRNLPKPCGFWEVGAGNGFVARSLAKRGVAVVAVEPGLGGATEAARRGVETIAARIEELGLPDASVPAAGAFDVIEHLEHPAPFLSEVHRVLMPGGVLLLTVPALSWLWSEFDEVAGHFRRYTKCGLVTEVRDQGFEVVRVSYFMAPLVPALYWKRARLYRRHKGSSEEDVLDRTALDQVPDPRSRSVCALNRLLAAERRLHRWVSLPLGTSIVGLFQKAG